MQAAYPILIQKQSNHILLVPLINRESLDLFLNGPPVTRAAPTRDYFRDWFLETNKRAYRFVAGWALGAIDNRLSQTSFTSIVSTRAIDT
jgi:hypothetical protein